MSPTHATSTSKHPLTSDGPVFDVMATTQMVSVNRFAIVFDTKMAVGNFVGIKFARFPIRMHRVLYMQIIGFSVYGWRSNCLVKLEYDHTFCQIRIHIL